MKTLKGKTTEKERGFHYNSEKITMVISLSHALGFLSLFDPPLLVGGDLLFIRVFLDKIIGLVAFE